MKNVYSLILIIVILKTLTGCSAKINKGNDSVQIIGEFFESADSSYVMFNRFFDENPEHYFFMYDSAEVINRRFKKSFKINHAGIITIAPNKYCPKIYIICDKGAKMNFTVKKEKKLLINFTGDNAKGQQLFYDSNLFKNNFLVGEFINIIKKSASTKDFISNAEKLKDSLFNPFNELLSKNEITATFHEIAKVQAELKILNAMDDALIDNLPNTSHMHDFDVNEIFKVFFIKYNPFSERYKYANMINRNVAVSLKCSLINDGVLKGKKTDLGIWKDLVYNSYAPIHLQENNKAVSIMLNRFYGINRYKKDLEDFNLFKEVFPNSAFIKPLSRYFKKSINENVKDVNVFTFGSFLSNKNQLIIEDIIETDNLDTIIEKKFKGKAVFVDLWATWCAPCIKEFTFLDSLHPFLKKNNVETLFVSIDAFSAGERWRNSIELYKLEGSHFLATNEITHKLKKKLNIDMLSIPRYLFFDKNGILLDDNLPRPSSGEKLVKRIEELMLK